MEGILDAIKPKSRFVSDGTRTVCAVLCTGETKEMFSRAGEELQRIGLDYHEQDWHRGEAMAGARKPRAVGTNGLLVGGVSVGTSPFSFLSGKKKLGLTID